MPKVLTVVGARPQFVKAGVLAKVLAQLGNAAPFEEVMVHTGQHYDANMSDVFFQDLGIPAPKHALGVGSGTSGYQVGKIMEGLQEIVGAERPTAILGYGDTNSTLAAALTATHLNIPFIHLESGERVFRRFEVPEEINRVIADNAAHLCLTSTRRAQRYLMREGFHPDRVRFVGDTMYDLFLQGKAVYRDRATLHPADFGVEEGGYHLATIHRAQNTTSPAVLLPILEAMDRSDLPVLFPIHPRTRKVAEEAGWTPKQSLKFIDPLGYYEFLSVLLGCVRVVTDSGGVTRESFFAEKPCIIPMENSWWVEIVESGWAMEVGTDAEVLGDALNSFVPANPAPVGLFGDGESGQRMVEEIGKFVGQESIGDGRWHRMGSLPELPVAASTTLTNTRYREILRGLKSDGYEFVAFPDLEAARSQSRKVALMRHDIDFDLGAALQMALIEQEEGVHATYFLMVRTDHYNVFSENGASMVRQILDAGHSLALHFDCASYPLSMNREELAQACDREAKMLEGWFSRPVEVVSYHRPAADVLTGDPAFSAPRPHTYMKTFTVGDIAYMSDSRGVWANGDPLESVARQEGKHLHILIHPIWWQDIATSPFEVLQQYADRKSETLARSMAANCKVYQVGWLASEGSK